MSTRLPVTTGIFCVIFWCAMVMFGHAQSNGTKQRDNTKNRYRISYTPVFQFATDMDGGGQFEVQRHLLRLDASRSITPHWTAGLGFSLDYEQWEFSNITGLHSVNVWEEIIRPGLSVPIFYVPSKNWRWGMIPSITYAGASGAKTSKSLSYGTVLSGTYVFHPGLMVGLGAGIFERLGQFEMFPYIVVNWKLNDQLRLTNPFSAGPVGPAGMELVYSPLPKMEIGVGGAYRSYRFRLDDSSLVTNGIGEVEFWASFFRIGWKVGHAYRVDINGGLLLDGSIAIEDDSNHNLGKSAFDTAPFIGLTLQGKF